MSSRGYISQNIVRMFYFSAVTVTTLGYGDIVPTELTSRVMVGTEAILGVLTIGLFLNALSIWPVHRDSQRGARLPDGEKAVAVAVPEKRAQRREGVSYEPGPRPPMNQRRDGAGCR